MEELSINFNHKEEPTITLNTRNLACSVDAKSFMKQIDAMCNKNGRLYGDISTGYVYEPRTNTFRRKDMNEMIKKNELSVGYYEAKCKNLENELRITRDANGCLKRALTRAEASRTNFAIKNVYFNKPYVIVLWEDKTKTMVKCGENDIYDPEKGLALAIAKKALGTNKSKSNYFDVFKKFMPAENEEATT